MKTRWIVIVILFATAVVLQLRANPVPGVYGRTLEAMGDPVMQIQREPDMQIQRKPAPVQQPSIDPCGARGINCPKVAKPMASPAQNPDSGKRTEWAQRRE